MLRVIKSSLFNLRVGTKKESRLSFSVSKKIDKRATRRNKLRRLFKASMYNLLGKSSHPDFLFTIRKDAVGKSQQEIQTNLEKTLKDEKII